jgi:hypothetical protein
VAGADPATIVNGTRTMRLHGKKSPVTGAGNDGIGRAIARE